MDWIPGQKITEDVIIQKADKSIFVPQRDKIKKELRIHERKLTDNQNKFLDIALNKNTKMLWISGPAGSSKTFLSILAGLRLLNLKKVSDLIYVRSVVESADAKMGYLPGEAGDKLSPYLEPLMEKLSEFLPAGDIQYLQKDERVTGMPVNYLRGLNWNAKCIVADEAQNLSFKELTTLITRIGEFSKLFITGDPMQSDIGSKSGFKPMFDLFNTDESKEKGVFCFEFTEEDIMRSDLVKYIVGVLRKHNEVINNQKK